MHDTTTTDPTSATGPRDDHDLRALVTDSVDARPWATLGAALILGFLLGRMLR